MSRSIGKPVLCHAAIGLLVGLTGLAPVGAPADEAAHVLVHQDTIGYRMTHERRALLNTIRYAEGTWKQGDEGYRTLYGGGRFSSLDKHPEVVVVKRYTSAAAGAYQFLPGTWKEAAAKLNLRSFKPQAQDQAALYFCLLYTSPSPRDRQKSRMPSSA